MRSADWLMQWWHLRADGVVRAQAVATSSFLQTRANERKPDAVLVVVIG